MEYGAPGNTTVVEYILLSEETRGAATFDYAKENFTSSGSFVGVVISDAQIHECPWDSTLLPFSRPSGVHGVGMIRSTLRLSPLGRDRACINQMALSENKPVCDHDIDAESSRISKILRLVNYTMSQTRANVFIQLRHHDRLVVTSPK